MKPLVTLIILISGFLTACTQAPASSVPAIATVDPFASAGQPVVTNPIDTPQLAESIPVPVPPLETEPASQSSTTAAGELYFFTLPHQAGQSVQMVRLPGSCVIKSVPCPALESIPAPFPFHFNLSALAWSPDG